VVVEAGTERTRLTHRQVVAEAEAAPENAVRMQEQMLLVVFALIQRYKGQVTVSD
jgi:hypothetical protein